MSRSKHTAPARVLAARRTLDTYAPRGHGNITDVRANLRGLKQRGILAGCGPTPVPARASSVRIHAVRPQPGLMHPASPAEVRAFLAQLGPECTYGLRSVDLVRRPVDDAGALCLGELRVPGRVLLFEQPSQPWLLPGRLTPADRDRLVTAGAVVAPQAGGLRTMVHWPGDTLRDFMLWDVLAHEVAHHVQQQYAGKRTARIHRTRDHEALAARLVQRLRSGAGVPSS